MKKKFIIITFFYISVILLFWGINLLEKFMAEKIFEDIQYEIDILEIIKFRYNRDFIQFYIEKYHTPDISEMVQNYLSKMPDNASHNFYLFKKGFYKKRKKDVDIAYGLFHDLLDQEKFNEATECYRIIFNEEINGKILYNNNEFEEINYNDIELLKTKYNPALIDLSRFLEATLEYSRYLKPYPYVKIEYEFDYYIRYLFTRFALYDILVKGEVDIMDKLRQISDMFKKIDLNFKKDFNFNLFFIYYNSLLSKYSKHIKTNKAASKAISNEMKKIKNFDLKKFLRSIKKKEPLIRSYLLNKTYFWDYS